MDTDTIVPGHGNVLHDKAFLYRVIDLMRYVVAKVEEALNRGDAATLEEVKKSLNLQSWRHALAGDESANGGFFDSYHEAKQRKLPVEEAAAPD